MDASWFQKLIDVLRVQTNSENEKLMVLYLDEELKKLKLPYTIDAAGNVLVTKGKAKTYPCVVSHMDTVHSFVPNFGVYQDIDDKDTLFALSGKGRVGIGGDDKCGVFACLYLLKVIPQIKVVFFSREESGCKGSRDIDRRFFSDCRYLIQLDRRGKGDFIQTYWGKKTISHEFSSEIGLIKKKYKYKNTIGTVTDVMKLWDNRVGVSCINLSCGYYQPHTAHEYVSVHALWNSVKFTEAIINNMQPKRYASLPPAPVVVTTPVVRTSYQSEYSQCDKCKQWKKEALLLYKDKSSNNHKKICWPCKKEQHSKKHNIDGVNNESNPNQCSNCKLWFTGTMLQKVGNKPLCQQCIKKLDVDYSKLPNGDIILFACYECGKRTDEMKKGDTLKYAGNDTHLYCNECASILFSASDEEASPKKCFVCDKVIPKDHKIIERFGTRVCEDCACPSDIEITDDKERFNGESNFVN